VIVCSCRAVTDRTIDAAIASGAPTIDEVTARCGAGGRCGGCWPELQRLLDAHDAAHTEPGQDVAA
jgi:bacterioferritin-associated ferredoxin